jgi:hypothetical protein
MALKGLHCRAGMMDAVHSPENLKVIKLLSRVTSFHQAPCKTIRNERPHNHGRSN